MICSVVYPGNFVAWVTCMFKAYEDSIVAGMLKRGYTVGTVSADQKLTHGSEKGPAVVTAFKIQTTNESKKASDVHTDLKSVLDELGVKFYSIIVSAYVDACWSCTNIVLPEPVAPPLPEEPLPEPDKNLN